MPLIISGSKCSNSKYGLTSFQFLSGTLPASTSSLNFSNPSKKPEILDIKAFFAPAQDLSFLFTIPFLVIGTFASTPANKHITAMKISSTPKGGLDIVLQLPNSFLSNDANAFIAFSTAGSAFAKSAAALVAILLASAAITLTFSSSIVALSVSSVTVAFSMATFSAISSATAFFSFASTSITSSSSCNVATVSAVSFSFCKPFDKRSIALLLSSRFLVNKVSYKPKSSKNDFGVV